MSGNIGGALTQSGLISPFQQSLARFNLGEGLVGNAQAFAQEPIGTPHTMADIGSVAQAALTQGEISNADAAALSQSINQQFGQLSSGLGSILGKGGGGGGGGGSATV